jgi:hypothetical protein
MLADAYNLCIWYNIDKWLVNQIQENKSPAW